MRRIDFLKLTLNGTLVSLIPALLVSCEDQNDINEDDYTTTIKLDINDTKYADLKSENKFIYLEDNNLILIHLEDSKYVALSSICTHQGCMVTYNAESNNLPCPCHGSLYSINGNVLNGPANLPLKVYPTKFSNNELTIYID